MGKSLKQMMDEANAVVPRITVAQAQALMDKGEAFVIDVRDAAEVEASGKVPGAANISRGLLEFRADPDSPSRDPRFAEGKTLVVYCASGGRSALAGRTLKELGYDKVVNLGGFKDWAQAGGKVEKA